MFRRRRSCFLSWLEVVQSAPERELLAMLADRKNTVIATGGGLLVDQSNMDAMKKYSMIFCLWASSKSIWRRVKDQSHRPLLQTENPKQRIIDLMNERKPAYSKADMLVNTEYRSAKEVAQLIYGVVVVLLTVQKVKLNIK